MKFRKTNQCIAHTLVSILIVMEVENEEYLIGVPSIVGGMFQSLLLWKSKMKAGEGVTEETPKGVSILIVMEVENEGSMIMLCFCMMECFNPYCYGSRK